MADLRVHRPSDKEPLIGRLAGDGEDRIFTSMRDLLVFAAVLGKSEGRRVELGRTHPDGIRVSLFDDPGHAQLIDTLAILEHPDDVDILREERLGERIEIFEEYANAGLEILGMHLAEKARMKEVEILQLLVNDLLERRRPKSEIELSALADELGF
jgi:dnd system-associated protein 4